MRKILWFLVFVVLEYGCLCVSVCPKGAKDEVKNPEGPLLVGSWVLQNSLGRVVLEQETAEVALAHLVPATNQLKRWWGSSLSSSKLWPRWELKWVCLFSLHRGEVVMEDCPWLRIRGDRSQGGQGEGLWRPGHFPPLFHLFSQVSFVSEWGVDTVLCVTAATL